MSYLAGDWGLDYIKIDGCRGAQDANRSWSRFHTTIEKCYASTGRQIVQSVESCDDPSACGQWVTKVANLWCVAIIIDSWTNART